MAKNKTIMIIDDSKVSRMMIIAIIKEKYPDHQFLEASNGDEAIEISTGKNIDSFSVDFNMPGMDGLELIEKLRKTFTKAKFALLTANIQQAIHDRAKSINTICINKPISETSIIKMLEYFDA